MVGARGTSRRACQADNPPPGGGPAASARAVRLAREAKASRSSEWAAITSIASKIGCNAETVHGWVRLPQRGQSPTAVSEERGAR